MTKAASGSAGPPVRSAVSVLVPRLVAVVVAVFSLTFLAIGARSPYTHANLLPGYDPGYTRTQQIAVGPAEPYGGTGAASGATANDATKEGALLYVTKGCVACHALQGRGGAAAPAIAGTDRETLAKKVYRGPGGMPPYSTHTLTEPELAAIAAYLGSLVAPDQGK